MKVYAITKNGYEALYGAEIFLIGVYDNEDKAKIVAKNNNARITEVEINKEYEMIPNTDGEYNSNYLGGHIE